MPSVLNTQGLQIRRAIADLRASSAPERTVPPLPSAPTHVSGPYFPYYRIIAYPKPISYLAIDSPYQFDTIFQDGNSLTWRE